MPAPQIAELSVLGAGAVAVVSGLVSGCISPVLLILFKERREGRRDKAVKERLMELLSEDGRSVRSLDRLTQVTGTDEVECRRLLRELGARGVEMADGRYGFTLRPAARADART